MEITKSSQESIPSDNFFRIKRQDQINERSDGIDEASDNESQSAPAQDDDNTEEADKQAQDDNVNYADDQALSENLDNQTDEIEGDEKEDTDNNNDDVEDEDEADEQAESLLDSAIVQRGSLSTPDPMEAAGDEALGSGMKSELGTPTRLSLGGLLGPSALLNLRAAESGLSSRNSSRYNVQTAKLMNLCFEILSSL